MPQGRAELARPPGKQAQNSRDGRALMTPLPTLNAERTPEQGVLADIAAAKLMRRFFSNPQ